MAIYAKQDFDDRSLWWVYGHQKKLEFRGGKVTEKALETWLLPELRVVEAASLLVYNGIYELGLEVDGGFLKGKPTKEGSTLFREMGNLRNMLTAGVYEGIKDGASFTQYMYIFHPGLMPETLKRLVRGE